MRSCGCLRSSTITDRLGVNRFLVVDNGSVDGTADYLSQQPDVHLYTAEGSFSESRFGFDWLHPLLDEYGSGHWVLTIDADKLFTYPSHEQINLQKLCRYLDGKGHEAMFAILLDMYSDRSIAETSYQAGNSLLDTCPYFDPGPYHVVRCMRFPTFESPGRASAARVLESRYSFLSTDRK